MPEPVVLESRGLEGWTNQILSFVKSTYNLYEEDYRELSSSIGHAIMLITCDAQWKCAAGKYGQISEPDEISHRQQVPSNPLNPF